MVKKIIASVLILLGLGALGFGVASGTIWKPDEKVTLKTGTLDKAQLVATSPGVVHQVNSQFTMTVTDPKGGEVVVVTGRVNDVTGWIGNSAHWLVTGASTWDQLDTKFVAEKADPNAPEATDEPGDEATTEPDAETPEEELVSPIASLPDSDMWLEVTKGKGTVTLTMDKVPDNIVFLAGALDPSATAAPQISLTWVRDVPTPLMIPGILAGALLIGIGLLLLVDSLRHSPDLKELEAQAAGETEDSRRAALLTKSLIEDTDATKQDLSKPASAFAPVDTVEPDADLDTAKDSAESATTSLDWANHEFSPVAIETAVPGEPEEDPSNKSADSGALVDADDAALSSRFGPATTAQDVTEPADEAASEDLAATAQESAEEVGEVVDGPAFEPVAGLVSEPAKPKGSWFSRLMAKIPAAPLSSEEAQPRADKDADKTNDIPGFDGESSGEGNLDQNFAFGTEHGKTGLGTTRASALGRPVPVPDHPTDAEAAAQDRETQEKLEAFAAMDEPDVTTGALQAAGLTRRQLREMRERKRLEEDRNIPTTTGSLDFGRDAVTSVPAPERPSWLPQGTDSTSASSWRAAWGVRDGNSQESQPEQEVAASPASETPPVPKAPVNEPDTRTDSEQEVPHVPTTRRALYSAYRATAERLANEEANEEQSK